MSWQEAMQRVELEMRRYQETLYDGLNAAGREKLAALTEERLGCAVPEEYLAFLKEHNGFEYNGTILYGLDEEYSNTEGVVGMLELNEIYRENEWNKAYLFLGEGNISWYVYELATERWLELDNPSGELQRVFEDLDALLTAVIGESLIG